MTTNSSSSADAFASRSVDATDSLCAELARHAFYCAEQLQLGTVGDNTLYGMRIRIPALADRIVALRTAQYQAEDRREYLESQYPWGALTEAEVIELARLQASEGGAL